MKLLLFSALLAVTTLSVACSGEKRGEQIVAQSTPVVVQKRDEDLRGEIASTLDGFFEAYLNGEMSRLLTYLSRTCTASDVESIVSDSLLFHVFSGGRFDVEIDKYGLNIRRYDVNHVTVLPRTDGGSSVTIKVDGRPLPLDTEVFRDADRVDMLDLVREDGVWRVANCSDLVSDDSDWEAFDAEGYR